MILRLCILSILVEAVFFSCSSRSGENYRNKVSRRNAQNETYKTDDTQNTKSEREIINGRNKEQPLTKKYEKLRKGVFLISAIRKNKNIQGSGFFINSNTGVSNAHVFENSKDLKIKTWDGKVFQVKQIKKSSSSEEYDYVIFNTAPTNGNYPNLKLSNKQPVVGESVFAIGNPRGLEQTLSTGIISALRNNKTLIQTTTEITFGSSGGPLFNSAGEVIGITTSGMGEANLNFAVSVDVIK